MLAGGGGAGGVVGIAKVDQVHWFSGQLRHKGVLRCARQVDQSGIGALGVGGAGVPGHDVGIHVNRVDGVHDGHAVAMAQDVEDVAAVALGTVGNEHLVVGHLQATVAEIAPGDGLAQEIVTLLRAVAAKRFASRHIISGAVQGGDGRSRQGFGNVTDPESDEAVGGVRVGFAEGLDASADLREEVTGLEF